MTNFRILAVAVAAGILSVGSAFADSHNDTVGSNQFSGSTVAVETSNGSTVIEQGFRQAGQPQNWAPIVSDQVGGH